METNMGSTCSQMKKLLAIIFTIVSLSVSGQTLLHEIDSVVRKQAASQARLSNVLDHLVDSLRAKSITVTSPITKTGSVIGISDAVANGTGKGSATFTASDFNSSGGVISIDYTNAQKATSSQPGLLTSTDWTTFNNKQNAGVGSNNQIIENISGSLSGSSSLTYDPSTNNFNVGNLTQVGTGTRANNFWMGKDHIDSVGTGSSLGWFFGQGEGHHINVQSTGILNDSYLYNGFNNSLRVTGSQMYNSGIDGGQGNYIKATGGAFIGSANISSSINSRIVVNGSTVKTLGIIGCENCVVSGNHSWAIGGHGLNVSDTATVGVPSLQVGHNIHLKDSTIINGDNAIQFIPKKNFYIAKDANNYATQAGSISGSFLVGVKGSNGIVFTSNQGQITGSSSNQAQMQLVGDSIGSQSNITGQVFTQDRSSNSLGLVTYSIGQTTSKTAASGFSVGMLPTGATKTAAAAIGASADITSGNVADALASVTDNNGLSGSLDVSLGGIELQWESARHSVDLSMDSLGSISLSGSTAVNIQLGVLGGPGINVGTTPIYKVTSQATNDDPTIQIIQQRTTSTSASAVSINLFATSSLTDNVISCTMLVLARRTGGTSGTNGDGAYYRVEGLFHNIGGTLTQIGSTTTTTLAESQVGWDATFNISGTTIRGQFTGAANNNITWHVIEAKIANLQQ